MGGDRGRRRVGLWVAAAGGVATLGVTALYAAAGPAVPTVDPTLARQVLPTIDRYLLTGPQGGPLGAAVPADSGDAPRAFCTERLIEIEPVGKGLRVGLVAWCGHFVREGDSVTELDAGIVGGVLTLSPASAPTRVSDVSWEPDGDPSQWAEAQFTPGGAEEVERVLHDPSTDLADPAV